MIKKNLLYVYLFSMETNKEYYINCFSLSTDSRQEHLFAPYNTMLSEIHDDSEYYACKIIKNENGNFEITLFEGKQQMKFTTIPGYFILVDGTINEYHLENSNEKYIRIEKING